MQSDRTIEAGTSGKQGPPSRRWFLGVSGAALLTAGCKDTGGKTEGSKAENAENASERRAVVPSGALGANFNEDPSTMDFSMLEGLSAGWLRGFVPMPDIDETPAPEQDTVKTLLSAHDQGYGTVLSLKFPYNHRPMPAVDSADMDDELARVDKVLDAAMGKVDILALANEPFIESLKKDHDDGTLNAFYEKVAQHVIAYRKKRFGERCRTRLYMGSLNHLDKPDWRTRATDRWMEFTRKTPEIEGVDIHPHVAAIEDSQKYLDYILPKLRHDQKFLVTEFSLVLWWKEHMSDTISAEFARQYKLPADTKVWQVIRQATEHPFTQTKWHDFLSMSPWYETHKHFLRNQMQKFRDTGQLAVATYGVAQAPAMVKDFGPRKPPWLLNSLYSNLTVQEGEGGKPARSYGFFDDFRALQRAEDRRPVRTAETTT